jgi:hypothetical protein
MRAPERPRSDGPLGRCVGLRRRGKNEKSLRGLVQQRVKDPKFAQPPSREGSRRCPGDVEIFCTTPSRRRLDFDMRGAATGAPAKSLIRKAQAKNLFDVIGY